MHLTETRSIKSLRSPFLENVRKTSKNEYLYTEKDWLRDEQLWSSQIGSIC